MKIACRLYGHVWTPWLVLHDKPPPFIGYTYRRWCERCHLTERQEQRIVVD